MAAAGMLELAPLITPQGPSPGYVRTAESILRTLVTYRGPTASWPIWGKARFIKES